VTAYYNEIDPKAAAWLRELIKQGHIAQGDVDETDIRDVDPDRLGRYTQCHFFAGIGGWSLALRLAGWPDSRPVWTGSCPCQPFSAAGRRAGQADERHLWPHWHHLISQCQPAMVFGEQVASKDGLGWLDLVQADMEATGYAFAAQDICAAGIGAPHIRQRLWFVGLADADCEQRAELGNRISGDGGEGGGSNKLDEHIGSDSLVSRLADANGGNASAEREQRGGQQRQQQEDSGAGCMADASGERHDGQQVCIQSGQPRQESVEAAGGGGSSWMANAESKRGCGGRPISVGRHEELGGPDPLQFNGKPSIATTRPSPTNGHWRDADWLFCRDGKWRPVEPGTFPLAHGLPARVGRLRGYGNAIVPQVAAAWIEAVMEYEEAKT
jgi:DNA (cytosine-5)-methyltransferase 1